MFLEIAIFYFLNGLAGQSELWDWVFVFLATNILWIMWILLIVFLVATYDLVVDPLVKRKRLARDVGELRRIDYGLLAMAFVSSGLAYVLNQVIGWLWVRERPFVALDEVNLLIEKSRYLEDKSFPSDHTTLAFALAFAVFIYDRRWGSVFITLALLQGLSRVIVGVHYMTDILGGILMALLVVWIVSLTVKKIILKFKD